MVQILAAQHQTLGYKISADTGCSKSNQFFSEQKKTFKSSRTFKVVLSCDRHRKTDKQTASRNPLRHRWESITFTVLATDAASQRLHHQHLEVMKAMLNTESVTNTICSLMTSSCTLSFLAKIQVARQRLTSCISVLRDLCASRRLQLNASKTELIWFGSTAAGHHCDAYRMLIALLLSTRWTFSRVMLSVTSGFCWTLNSHLNIT